MEEGDFARAAERFRQALAKDPSDFQSRLSLGACQLELGRSDEAFASLRTAVQATPNAYPMALKVVVTSARGRFWLRPSAAAKFLKPGTPA
jgi:cytochrome c-type biogenesis protein CcmH/NrfG